MGTSATALSKHWLRTRRPPRRVRQRTERGSPTTGTTALPHLVAPPESAPDGDDWIPRRRHQSEWTGLRPTPPSASAKENCDKALVPMALSLLVEVTLIIPRTNAITGRAWRGGRRRTQHLRSATSYLAISGSRVIRVRAWARA